MIYYHKTIIIYYFLVFRAYLITFTVSLLTSIVPTNPHIDIWPIHFRLIEGLIPNKSGKNKLKNRSQNNIYTRVSTVKMVSSDVGCNLTLPLVTVG